MKADIQYTVTEKSKFQSLELIEYKEVRLLNKLVPRLRKEVIKTGRPKEYFSHSFSVIVYNH